MSKGLFISLPAHGHINPTIGLVSELAKKGDEIVYITAEEFRDKFEKVGARFVGYNFEGGSASLNIKEIAKNASDSSDLVNVVKKVMEQAMIKYKIAGSKTIELALRLNEEFDYLVIDDIFTLDISEVISKLKIKKVISTVTMFALNAKLKSNMYSTFLPSIMKNENDVCHGFDKLAGGKKKLDEQIDLRLVFTSEYFQPCSEEFDDSFEFVGPSIFDRNELTDFKIEKSNDKKLILISLGTMANENLDFYRNCFEALGSREDIDIIMSIGKRININDLGVIPKNFKLYNYIPQLEVLKQVDLFITHGGMNSTSEGLYHNIPLIIVPQFGDQATVAKRVSTLGAGIALIGRDNYTADSIKLAVDKILFDNLYKENAFKIGKSLRDAGGYKKGAEIIKSIL
ncbi:Oleandomycin glycosyltransferase [Sarcina ventriculi]|uniref:macrolide family glycosyltransferase n=1 Tax=Sarcina ventriculi TaxID=1267 RepID=UPI000D896C27|nr:macrolide family glycosyltransferase [Sarcina ventriculi]SPZ51061.1 Oleandomycin glycosyltransferase [Sarcina ventriculi]